MCPSLCAPPVAHPCGFSGWQVRLVLFEDAMCHFVRIARMLRTPRCSALLVGVGGSGRQSLTRLAAYVNGCITSQITITKTYNIGNLLEDWKPLCFAAGVKATGVAFIFTDKEIKDEVRNRLPSTLTLPHAPFLKLPYVDSLCAFVCTTAMIGLP